jgi:hypothetical protein
MRQACERTHRPPASKPFQTYFETGFPPRKGQFISRAASSWATTALSASRDLAVFDGRCLMVFGRLAGSIVSEPAREKSFSARFP